MRTSVTRRLKQIPLFSQLGREDLSAVARLLKREQCRAGDVIYTQGQLGRDAYLVESGELKAWHANPEGLEQEAKSFGPGAFFGESALILSEPHDVTMRVVADATVLSLSKSAFDQLLEQHPSLRRRLVLRSDVARKLHARRFRWQEPGETISLAMHKHDAVLIRLLLLPVFVLLVAVVVALSPGFVPHALRVAAGILALMPIGAIVYLLVDHFNDYYVVTSKRVLHEERVFIIREHRSEAPLHMIQDVHQSQQGLIAHLFDFGDLIIETAGERGHVVFRQIRDPNGVRAAIFDQIERVHSVARLEERAAIRSALHRQFGSDEPAQGGATEPALRVGAAGEERTRWANALRKTLGFVLPPLRDEQGDTITWRKHWIGLLRPIAPPTVGIVFVTLVALFLLYRGGPDWTAVLLGYGVALVVFFPWWLWQWSDWQNDVYQVTATRIIDVERRPFFLSEERREASLGRIQNVSLTVPGPLGRLLNYGSVTVETAGEGAFTFDYVKNPRDVQAEIFRRMDAFQHRQHEQDAERRRIELMDWFAVYDQVRGARGRESDTQPLDQRRS